MPKEPLPVTRPRNRPTPPTCGLEIDLYDCLGRAAMRRDRVGPRTDWALQFRLWTVCRALDAEGDGRVPISAVMDALDGVRGFGRASLSLITRAGEGLWWRACNYESGTVLYLAGIESVARALGVKVSHPIRCRMPRRLAHFRALVAMGFAAQRPEPRKQNKKKHWRPHRPVVSRERIGDMAGIEPGSVSSYSRALGGLMVTRANVIPTGTEWKSGDEIPPGFRPDRLDGDLVLCQVLPNSYKLSLRRERRRHVNRTNANNSPDLKGTETGDHGRRLFWDADRCQDLTRRLGRAREGEVFIAETGGTTWGRARTWSKMGMFGGKLLSFSLGLLKIRPPEGGGRGGGGCEVKMKGEIL